MSIFSLVKGGKEHGVFEMRIFGGEVLNSYLKTRGKEQNMVTINGEQKDIAGQNLYQYLKEAGFDLDRVVVERNLDIVPKDGLEQIIIQEEDTIEVLRFVGGG